jgi:hypothetical protein
MLLSPSRRSSKPGGWTMPKGDVHRGRHAVVEPLPQALKPFHATLEVRQVALDTIHGCRLGRPAAPINSKGIELRL